MALASSRNSFTSPPSTESKESNRFGAGQPQPFQKISRNYGNAARFIARHAGKLPVLREAQSSCSLCFPREDGTEVKLSTLSRVQL